MTNSNFRFGHKFAELGFWVLNECADRKSAYVLFSLPMVSFMNAWLISKFQLTQAFAGPFLVDFSSQISTKQRFRPWPISWRWIVKKQQPQHVGALLKRLPRTIGFASALAGFSAASVFRAHFFNCRTRDRAA